MHNTLAAPYFVSTSGFASGEGENPLGECFMNAERGLCSSVFILVLSGDRVRF